MILTKILERNAKDFPEKTALVMKMDYRTVSLSYQDVYDLAKKIAIFLENQGLKKDDKVLLLAPNSPYWITVFWGCLLRKAVLVPLNIQSTGEMVRKIAEQTGAKILFKYLRYGQELPQNLKIYNIDFLPEYLSDIDTAKFSTEDAALAKSDRRGSSFDKTPPIIKEEDIVELMYTSGTTGDPKGVILTHKNMYSSLEALSSIIPISPDDKFLSILPLSHIYEQMGGFLLPFSNASQIVYVHSPSAIRDLLKEHQVTTMVAVPEFLGILMSKIEVKMGNGIISRLIFRLLRKKFIGNIKTVSSGGAPLDIALEKKWNALGIDLLQGYGLTETSSIVSFNTYKEYRLGSVGKILPRVEVKIASDGEILVKGQNVFQSYFKNEQKTKESFSSDGWFMTGDIGKLDRDGFLYIYGRKKYMIKGPGAQNVYPEDIELELNKMPGVKDSCVVGLPKLSGQVEIHAVLLAASPRSAEWRKGKEKIKDPDKIITEVNKKLSSYQQIGGWSIWSGEDFPRSATRKVKKEEVLSWLETSKIGVPAADMTGVAVMPLMRILAEITHHNISEIGQKTKIVSELNLDSLLRVELVSRIEEMFGTSIEEAKIDPETTVLDLEKMIKKQEPIRRAPPFKNWPFAKWISAIRMLAQILIIFPLAKIFIKLKIEGKERLENLPLPAIFMPNHVSFLDSLVLIMALPLKIRRKIAFAAAQDVLYEQYKKVAWLAELFFGTFPFPRQEHENIKAGLEHIGRLLDKNWSIAVYPEGKMSLTGELLPLKRGAGLIGVEMDSCIVLVKISGTADILPADRIIPRKRGLVTVKFGKPIKFKKSDSYIKLVPQ